MSLLLVYIVDNTPHVLRIASSILLTYGTLYAASSSLHYNSWTPLMSHFVVMRHTRLGILCEHRPGASLSHLDVLSY